MDQGIEMRGRCLCCESGGGYEHSALSKFFAARVFKADANSIVIFKCDKCGTRRFDISISEDDLSLLYSGYRGASYFEQRHSFEPWYTRAFNDGIGGEDEFRVRRLSLLNVLKKAGIENKFESVLDHGGDRGQMVSPVSGVNSRNRYVYDISGVEPDEGVAAAGESDLKGLQCDLILSCHVLEHLPNPIGYLEKLKSIGKSNSYYFIEVPSENYFCFKFNGSWLQKKWVELIVSTKYIFMLVDFISTALRVKFNIVPPLGIVPLREHLHFYTEKGITSLLKRCEFEVLVSGKGESGHTLVLAKKAPPSF